MTETPTPQDRIAAIGITIAVRKMSDDNGRHDMPLTAARDLIAQGMADARKHETAALRAALERACTALEMFEGSDAFIPAIGKQSADEADHDAERREMITRVASEALTAARRALEES